LEKAHWKEAEQDRNENESVNNTKHHGQPEKANLEIGQDKGNIYIYSLYQSVLKNVKMM
jgi:hypothetical protein